MESANKIVEADESIDSEEITESENSNTDSDESEDDILSNSILGEKSKVKSDNKSSTNMK